MATWNKVAELFSFSPPPYPPMGLKKAPQGKGKIMGRATCGSCEAVKLRSLQVLPTTTALIRYWLPQNGIESAKKI